MVFRSGRKEDGKNEGELSSYSYAEQFFSLWPSCDV